MKRGGKNKTRRGMEGDTIVKLVLHWDSDFTLKYIFYLLFFYINVLK